MFLSLWPERFDDLSFVTLAAVYRGSQFLTGVIDWRCNQAFHGMEDVIILLSLKCMM